MHHELEHTWSRIQAELRRSVTDSTYHLWLAPLRAQGLDGDTLLVGAPEEIRTWVADRFSRVLQACAAAVLGPAAAVAVVPLTSADATYGAAGAQRGGRPAATAAEDETFNPKYTFGQFVIGDGNRLAHAAALAVAELPGQAYNPLFIYGPPGLGKTHLLHAIANYVREYGDGLKVRYTTTEAFTNHFLEALGSSSVDEFKRRYRDTDILLIDDVQFLDAGRKAKTEEEFFHTFNALYETGSQLVITCDRMPRDMGALADRLRERFESGLVTDIRPPDHATRLTILRKRVQHDEVRLAAPDAIEPIADRITTNIRALQGALIRVVAYHSLTGKPIDRALVTHVLDGLYPHTAGPRQRTVEEIQQLTCERLGVSPEALRSPDRTARVAWARQVAMYLARELTDATLPAIGRAFGGRNHTTVLHACRRASERIANDSEAYELVRGLTARLQEPDDDRGS